MNYIGFSDTIYSHDIKCLPDPDGLRDLSLCGYYTLVVAAVIDQLFLSFLITNFWLAACVVTNVACIWCNVEPSSWGWSRFHSASAN